MMFKLATSSVTLLIILLTTGCHRGIRVAIQHAPMFSQNAPDWVSGDIPQSESRIYFVGRSVDRYLYSYHQRDGRWYQMNNRRLGFNNINHNNLWMTERAAVSSARDDIYDQIRQRLAPRNVGASSNMLVYNIDSGTCVDCDTTLPLFRSNIVVCNESCTHSGETCNSKNYKTVANSTSKYCGDCHDQVASCSGCGTIVHAITQLNRTPDQLNSANVPVNRDINMMNINVDSLMPSLAAYMTEDELYFERRSDWNEYKCWMLCSIPADEFYSIAESFRNKYEDMYNLALERAESDRLRRIAFEDESRKITIERQESERKWNREDELVTRAHAIEIDKDRQDLPGRRFTLEDE